MNLGISTYTFTWAIGVPNFEQLYKPMTLEGLFKKALELGVNLVQICDNFPLHKLDNGELNNIFLLASKMGIEIEIGTRGVNPEHLIKYLEIAKHLNAKLVRTMIHADDSTPSIEEAAAWIRQIERNFSDSDTYIAIENHDKHKSQELVNLIKKVDSPYVGICLDTVNSFGALECPKQVINLLAPHAVNLHIKDFNITRVQHQMGFSVMGCAAGDGLLDIEGTLSTLLKCGRNPNVILELWTPFTETIEKTVDLENQWSKKSVEYLRRIIK